MGFECEKKNVQLKPPEIDFGMLQIENQLYFMKDRFLHQ